MTASTTEAAASPPTSCCACARAVESTTDLVTFHARGGRVLFANRAARELIGIGPDDPLPRLEMDEFFDDDAGAAGRDAPAIIEHGRWAGELDVRGRDLRIPASVVVSGHRDADGRYEYFSALSRDISEQRAIDAGAAPERDRAARRSCSRRRSRSSRSTRSGTVHVWNHAARGAVRMAGRRRGRRAAAVPRVAPTSSMR